MTSDGELALLYVPCGSEEEALKIAGALLEARLIACANIYESRSLYTWNGALADEKEQVLICKTTRGRAMAAEKLVEELHTYDIPCIIQAQPAQANQEFVSWVKSQVES